MDDSFYYRVKSIEADLEWIAAEVRKVGASNVIESETKRHAMKKMLVNISRHANTINSSMDSGFTSEFQDVQVQ